MKTINKEHYHTFFSKLVPITILTLISVGIAFSLYVHVNSMELDRIHHERKAFDDVRVALDDYSKSIRKARGFYSDVQDIEANAAQYSEVANIIENHPDIRKYLDADRILSLNEYNLISNAFNVRQIVDAKKVIFK